MRLKECIFILLGIMFVCLSGCRKEQSKLSIPYNSLHEGDIAFRRGRSISSDLISFAEKHGIYSHVGILKKEGNTWYVIHTVPGEAAKNDIDRIKMEAIEQYFSSSKAAYGAIMRVKCDSTICAKAARDAKKLFYKKIPFDYSLNMNDTTKMYCTELIDFIYKKEGIDITDGKYSKFHVLNFKGIFILPSDIQNSKKLNMVCLVKL